MVTNFLHYVIVWMIHDNNINQSKCAKNKNNINKFTLWADKWHRRFFNKLKPAFFFLRKWPIQRWCLFCSFLLRHKFCGDWLLVIASIPTPNATPPKTPFSWAFLSSSCKSISVLYMDSLRRSWKDSRQCVQFCNLPRLSSSNLRFFHDGLSRYDLFGTINYEMNRKIFDLIHYNFGGYTFFIYSGSMGLMASWLLSCK